MLERFIEHTRCPEGELLALLGDTHAARRTGPGMPMATAAQCRMASPAEAARWVAELLQPPSSESELPAILERIEAVIGAMRLEQYIQNSVATAAQPGLKAAIRQAYYLMRPLFPVSFRKYLQRAALRGWDSIAFPSWPVDVTIERLMEHIWRLLLGRRSGGALPFIWFWPDGHDSACIMTHDVETAPGRDFCATLMRMEQRVDVRSAFEVVPEQRYAVPAAFLQEIRDAGCEVCIHGLNHDGRLFSSEDVFFERAQKINAYAQAWNARGFRSPVMYRNLAWLPALAFSYDMSVPNVGHLDPQRGGCCTVMPYFIGRLLELPLTTIQDYSLFNILQRRSLELWTQQIRLIREEHGLISFIVHPDYIQESWSTSLYASLLGQLAELRREGVWLALPREVDAWWRARAQMRLIRQNDEWAVAGPEAQRARVAFACLEGGRVAYKVQGKQAAGGEAGYR